MKSILTLSAAVALVFASPQVINAGQALDGPSALAAQQEKQSRERAKPAGEEAAKQDGAKTDEEKAAKAVIVRKQLPFYPSATCVISGEPLGEDATNTIIEGRLVRTCCKKCARKAEETSAEIIAKLDAQAIAAQMANYPMVKCIISDEELGGMGEPLDMIHEGRLVRLCCEGCVKSFKKDAERYFGKIDAAMIAKQKPTYTFATCPVSGEALEGMDGAVDHLYGDRLVRLCCNKCVATFRKEPAKYLAMLDAQAK